LNPGAYRVLVTASGFMRQEYGQRPGRLNSAGTPIYLDPGQTVKELAIQLTPTAIVSGRIFDKLGQPAPRWPPQNRPLMATQIRPLNNDVRDKVFYSFSLY
jgi:hypothetical protein